MFSPAGSLQRPSDKLSQLEGNHHTVKTQHLAKNKLLWKNERILFLTHDDQRSEQIQDYKG